MKTDQMRELAERVEAVRETIDEWNNHVNGEAILDEAASTLRYAAKEIDALRRFFVAQVGFAAKPETEDTNVE